jgi:hypothetical protein
VPNLPMLIVLTESQCCIDSDKALPGVDSVRVGPDCYDPLYARGCSQNYLCAWAHATMHNEIVGTVSEIITPEFGQ